MKDLKQVLDVKKSVHLNSPKRKNSTGYSPFSCFLRCYMNQSECLKDGQDQQSNQLPNLETNKKVRMNESIA